MAASKVNSSRIVLLAAVSLLQMQAVMSGLLPVVDKLAGTSASVLAGTPNLAAFQNRILAPVIQQSLQSVAGLPPSYAFLALIFASIVVLNVAWLRWIGDAGERWLAYFAFSAIWVLLADYSNFLPWDLPDLIVFSLLAFAIVDDRRLGYFAALFALALFNRETALFIGVWLAASALRPFDRARLASGVGMVAVGGAIVFGLRKLLHVQSAMMGDVAGGTFIAFGRNWSRLMDQLHFPSSAPFLAVLGLSLAVLVALAVSDEANAVRRLSTFALFLMVAGLSFGLWTETRVFLDVAPFIAIILALVNSRSLPSR